MLSTRRRCCGPRCRDVRLRRVSADRPRDADAEVVGAASRRARRSVAAGLTEGDKLYLQTVSGRRSFIAGVNLGSTLRVRSPASWRRAPPTTAAGSPRWPPSACAPCASTRSSGRASTRSWRLQHAHIRRAALPGTGRLDPEDAVPRGRDLFAPAVRDGFAREIDDAVRAVHGELRRSPRRGAASGTWTADVSPWLLPIVGVEWDPSRHPAHRTRRTPAGPPSAVTTSRRPRTRRRPRAGWPRRSTAGSDEAARGLTVPLTFTNWPTTDPLAPP